LSDSESPRYTSIAASITKELRKRISNGTYRVHSYLPSERQLAAEFHTSRLTVAKAMKALAQDRLVLRSPGRGTRVLPVLERLSHPTIGLIHGEFRAMEAASLRDSLETLQGVRDTLERFGFKYETVPMEQGGTFQVQECLNRFGALISVEEPVGVEELLELERQHQPVVVAKLETGADIGATWVDHRAPILQAVRTFVNFGHERIAFVGRERRFGFYAKAQDAYLAGLQEAGLPVDESLIGVCEKTDALSGYSAANSLLRSSNRPTAVMAARDCIAEGVCRAIEEAGLEVGHHVSVIGFDDTTWPDGRAFLTTFREPCYEMGAAAAEMLIQRIVDGDRPISKRKFETPFLLRRTAGPLRQAGMGNATPQHTRK